MNKGEGLRASDNEDKLRLDYIPPTILASYIRGLYQDGDCLDMDDEKREAFNVLRVLGRWVMRGGCAEEMLEQLSPSTLELSTKVFDFGAKKYAPWNWAYGMDWMKVAASMERHIWAYLVMNEENDPESGIHHMGHVACNVIMLCHYENYYEAGDNRPPGEVF